MDEARRRRRAAVAAILQERAGTLLERMIAEAVTASSAFGLTDERVKQFAAEVGGTLSPATEAIAADDAERERLVAEFAAQVRGITVRHHVPFIVERGLVRMGFAVGGRLVREGAAPKGFRDDELASEFDQFRAEFEGRLFGRDSVAG